MGWFKDAISSPIGQVFTGGNLVQVSADAVGLKDDNFFRTGGMNDSVFNGQKYTSDIKNEEITSAITAANHAGFTTTNPGLIDPTYGSAADRLGQIEKQDWLRYQQDFIPIENQLMQQTTYMNPNLASSSIKDAKHDTAKAYDNIAGSQAIQLGRYGMSLTADQQQSSDRLNALGRSGAIVDAANNIRLKLIERNQQIASGTAQAAASNLRQQGA